MESEEIWKLQNSLKTKFSRSPVSGHFDESNIDWNTSGIDRGISQSMKLNCRSVVDALD